MGKSASAIHVRVLNCRLVLHNISC